MVCFEQGPIAGTLLSPIMPNILESCSVVNIMQNIGEKIQLTT